VKPKVEDNVEPVAEPELEPVTDVGINDGETAAAPAGGSSDAKTKAGVAAPKLAPVLDVTSIVDTKSKTPAGATPAVSASQPGEASKISTGSETVRGASPSLSAIEGFPPLLSKKSGILSVMASERDARVFVDGREIGAAPIKNFTIKGGTHIVRVEKTGYVAASTVLDVDGGTPQASLALVPLKQTRADYESNVWLWRTLGYAGLSLGGIATLAGVGVAAWGLNETSAVRRDIDKFNQSAVRGEDTRKALVERRDRADLVSKIGEVSLLSGLVVVAAGVVAYMVAGDPDRYAAYGPME
jgi:hypothetical protein